MIGEKGIVGVGAVVTMDVLPGTIVALVPVSILRRIEYRHLVWDRSL